MAFSMSPEKYIFITGNKEKGLTGTIMGYMANGPGLLPQYVEWLSA